MWVLQWSSFASWRTNGMAELSASNPEAGGLYCFIRDGFGRIPAFLYGWSLFLVIASGTVAALARAFTRYLCEIIPLSTTGATIVAVLMIGVVTAVNVRGTRESSDLAELDDTHQGSSDRFPQWLPSFSRSSPERTGRSDGHHATRFRAAFQFWPGDDRRPVGLRRLAIRHLQCRRSPRPPKILPQRIPSRLAHPCGPLPDCQYVAYLVALGPAAATASDAIAATAAAAVLGPWAGKIIALTILISTFSAANSVILTAPRVFYAMANDNLFFKKLAEVHPRFRTPAAAVIALGVWSAVLACAGKFAELIGGVVFIGWVFYGLGAAAIFPIRRALQGKPIPYRVPGYPVTPFLFVLAATAIVANAIYLAFRDPLQFRNLTVAIVLFLLGLPAYYFWRRRAA